MKIYNIQQQIQNASAWLLVILSVLVFCVSASFAYASKVDGTIVSGGNVGFAWSDQAGWINFGTVNGAIHITDVGFTGYSWSSNYGWINMAPSNGGLSVAANGAITGYVWGSGLGWINFSGVTINSSGKFTGQATGVNVGTLTFDCTNCDVRTDFRPSSFRTLEDTSAGGGSSGGSIPLAQPAAVTPSITPEIVAPGITVPPTPVELIDTDTTPSEEDELLPEELFDIRLIIDRANINSFQDLVARVTFESFGRVPTPVDLTFTILNAAGEVVLTGKDQVTIETTGVFVKRFTGEESLSPGNYTVRLHTLYNVDVEDDFEAAFTIGAAGGVCTSFLSVCLIWWIIGGAVLFIILFYLLVWKRRNKEEKVVQPNLQSPAYQ